MAAIGNLITEAALDAMKRRGWVKRTREPLPDEGRVLARLWHPTRPSAKEQTAITPPSRRSAARRSSPSRASSASSRPPSIQEIAHHERPV
jgi:hypothetical protein